MDTMSNTKIPFCPYCTIVVPSAADKDGGICPNCERGFHVEKHNDNTYSTKKHQENSYHKNLI